MRPAGCAVSAPSSAKRFCASSHRQSEHLAVLIKSPAGPRPAPLIFVVIGPSGVGKGSIAGALAQQVPRLWLSRSWTTRPRRGGEPVDAYEFVEPDAFASRREAGGFIETAQVFGHYYGTPVPDPPDGHDLLLEIDVQGAAQVRRQYPDAVVILIQAPSREAQEQRLRNRGDDDAVIVRRLAKADEEEAAGRALANHIVINDDLSRAVEEAAAIVDAHRKSTSSSQS